MGPSSLQHVCCPLVEGLSFTLLSCGLRLCSRLGFCLLKQTKISSVKIFCTHQFDKSDWRSILHNWYSHNWKINRFTSDISHPGLSRSHCFENFKVKQVVNSVSKTKIFTWGPPLVLMINFGNIKPCLFCRVNKLFLYYLCNGNPNSSQQHIDNLVQDSSNSSA